MTQRANQSTIIRAGENPYLERIMRLIGIGVSIAVTFFALAGISGISGATNNQLDTSQSGGLIRIENAIQTKLDRYSADLISLRNDQNLIDHITGSENVRTASARAGEIIALNLNEYERIQFIEIRDGQAFLAFDRANNNNSVSDVTPYENLAYTAPAQSQNAFTSVLNGTAQSIVLSDFYLRSDDSGRTDTNNVVLLDAYIPVYIGTAPAMIINLQINATELRNIVNLAIGELVDGEDNASSRRVLWLVGTDNIIADSGSVGTNYIENLESAEGNVDGDTFYESLVTADGLLLGTTEPIRDFSQNTIYSSRVVQYENLPNLSWRIIITDSLSVYYTSTISLMVGISILALTISVIVVVVIKQILRPMLQQVYEADTLIQTSARESNIAVRSIGDQGELVAAARRVSTRINRLTDDLEKETQRRNRDMQVAGRIGRETATLTNLDTLATTTISLICNEFGFYHAQIFLLDQSRTNAVLRYSRGDAGNELIQRGHQLRVGSDSIVGTVAIEKRPVIVNDTQENSDIHEVNPLLRDTRSEMGLPLLIGDTIIGVLDIQSRYAHSFLKDDISTYQLVADQLAVGIYNAQLREQTDQRIGQIDSLNRQLTRDAWTELEDKLELRQDYGAQIDDAKLATNISIRGEVIGSFEASLPEGQQFSEADRQILNSVTERVSLALENARLFQETQTSLSETSILYQLSRLLNEADDLEDVLQAIIVSVAANASGGQVWLFDESLPSQNPDWARATIDIPIKERDNQILLIDRRLQLSQYPFMGRLSGDTTVAVENLNKVDIHDDLRRMFSTVNAIALLFIPLNMRGVWKGFMSITFAEAQSFSERDQRIYDALIAQAGVAIDNRLLLQQTEVALERQEKLYAASRIINTSQSLSDLVFATVATASNPSLNFWLGLLKGNSDEEGWTQTVDIIAKSQDGEVEAVLEVHPVFSPEHSPMRRREPEILVDPGEDIQDVPEPVQWMRSLGYTFVAMFPLFSDNMPIAIFYIVSENPYDLSQDDYEVYRALTGQMSTQIQNRNLYSQTEQTLNEIRRLYVATRAISGAQDTSAIYDAVAGHLAMPFIQQSARLEQELNVSITVLLATPQADIHAPQLRYDYIWHSNPVFHDDEMLGRIISQEDAPFGSLISQNDDGALVYKTLEDTPKDFPMIAEILGENGATSAIVAPLWSRLRWFGVMILRTDQAQLLDEGYQRFVQSISDQVAIAVENQQLLAETLFERQATEYLYNANTAISQARGNEELFAEVEKLLDVLQPDMRAGYLINGQDVEPMFKNGFEESEANGFDLDKLMVLQLPLPEGLYVADITRNTLSPFELEVIHARNITAFAAINLNVNNIPRGRLLVAYKDARNFDPSDERYLSAIADSASIVLNNQLLLSQVQDTLQETSILYQASKALIETVEYNEIIDVIVTYLIAPNVNQVFIALLKGANWDAPSATVEVVATWQDGTVIDLLGVELSADEFPAWTQLSTNSTLTINDIHDENSAIDELEKMSIDTLNMRSLAVLPLRVPGRDIGAIWIASSEVTDYTDRDLRVFQSFAEQTSLSLEAKRLLEQTEERARQLQTSAVISQSIGQILDLDVLLPQVVDLIRAQFQYDHVQVFLMDDDNDWALLRASTGEAGQELLSINHRLQRGSASVIGQVTDRGEPAIALDTADAEVIHKPNPYLPSTRSEIALPMIVKGEIVGALDVQSNRPNAFNEDDIQVLTTLSAQIAVAIDNARLYEDIEKSAEDMSFLFDITTTAAAAQTLNEALNNVAHQIKENVRSDVVAIYLTQDYEDYYGNRKKMIEANAVASDNNIHIDSLISVEIDARENTLARVATNLQPQVIVNIDRDVRYQSISGASKSAVLVPITSRADLVGIIAIESNRLNVYTNDTVVLLQTLAGSLAAIIQNTLLVEQLQTSNEQLREVDRLKSQFLASMSHELRTPLNSIIGFSRVMLKGIDGPLSEMQEQDLTTIYNSGNHLLRLINDILDQAKIEANEINLKFGYFDIKPVVESVRSIAIGLMKEKPNLRLNIQIADGLPKAYGDEFRSRQILLNLVTNAIKFTQEGSVTLDVYAIENEPAPLLMVDVIDTGMGIEASDLGTVFEQFRQVDNSLTRTVGGTGLGLPISKSFAELQGGNLTVASEIGVGSTFSVTIPTFEGAEEALESLREEQRAGQKAVSAQSPTSTASGLISKSDVEKAKRLAEMKHQPDVNGTDEINKVDTQEFQKHKNHSGRIDTNVTQNIPLMTQKRDVILVEDDKTMVDQFRRILQREGFEVSTADFAAFAEAMIGQLRPNVVILDVNFANGVGWDLLKNLKERDDTFDIPVVVTTIDEDSERAYRLGAHTFIQRPFLPEDVLEAVLEAEKESNYERILIIDDQEDTIRLLTHLLEEHSDFKIYSAKSGDEGISLVARRRPDLIILDLRMPGKDGFAVLDELRGNPETAKIPVLVVTGEMDLNNSEQEQLVDIHVLQKTDISQEEYDLFIENVRSYLETNHRK